MTIEINMPEPEALFQQRLQAGRSAVHNDIAGEQAPK
jgi:hypothetical protein